MTSKVRCPTCGKQFAARDELIGRRVRCPGCKEPFVAEREDDLPLSLMDLPDEPVVFNPPMAPSVPRRSVKVSHRAPTFDRADPSLQRNQRQAVILAYVILGVGAVRLVLGSARSGSSLTSGQVMGTVVPCLAAGAVWLWLGKSQAGGQILVALAKWGSFAFKAVAILFVAAIVLVIGGYYLYTAKFSKPSSASSSAPSWKQPSASPSASSNVLPPGVYKGDMAGGKGGGPYVHPTPNLSPVVGFRYSMGKWIGRAVLRDFDPISLDEAPNLSKKSNTILARDGYIVSGLGVDSDGVNAVAARVTFARYRNGRADLSDQYTSDWIGIPSGGREVTLGNTGRPVVGTFGRKGMNMDGLGLLLLDPNTSR